jgi:hypothetical protein
VLGHVNETPLGLPSHVLEVVRNVVLSCIAKARRTAQPQRLALLGRLKPSAGDVTVSEEVIGGARQLRSEEFIRVRAPVLCGRM